MFWGNFVIPRLPVNQSLQYCSIAGVVLVSVDTSGLFVEVLFDKLSNLSGFPPKGDVLWLSTLK